MSERLLTIEEVARRLRCTEGTAKGYSSRPDFPPPREYGPHGRRLYACEDIDFWNAGHSRKSGPKPKVEARRESKRSRGEAAC